MTMRDQDRINELQEYVGGLLLAVNSLVVAVSHMARTMPASEERLAVEEVILSARLAMSVAETKSETARAVGEQRYRDNPPRTPPVT